MTFGHRIVLDLVETYTILSKPEFALFTFTTRYDMWSFFYSMDLISA
jgi:hypothetical protein